MSARTFLALAIGFTGGAVVGRRAARGGLKQDNRHLEQVLAFMGRLNEAVARRAADAAMAEESP